MQRLAFVLGAWALASGSAGATAETAPTDSTLGIRTTFERLIELRQERERGRVLALGPGDRAVPNPLTRGLDAANRPTLQYSALTGTVFELSGPGYLPADPEYYQYDGAYYVYEPASYDDPSLELRARPRDLHQRESLAEARRGFWLKHQQGSRSAQGERGPGTGITVTVPFQMKGALAEVFGRGATNLKVSGRENISFAGESRRLSPFVPGEQGRGQSLFPRLDMKQDLQVKLEGSIGDKVKVNVDHNSNAFGADANKINIYYEGYEDDIVRRVDLGGTNLSLTGSNLVSFSGGGGAKGLFGVKSSMRLGGLDLTVIASKEEADVETRTVSGTGASSQATRIPEYGYAKDRFFFYEKPDSNNAVFYDTYGIDPDLLIDQEQIPNFHVFVDNRDANDEPNRPVRGYGVEGLPRGLSDLEMDAFRNTTEEARRYPNDGSNQGKWRKLDNEQDVGFVFIRRGTRTLVLGFYLRNGAAGGDDAIGVVFQNPGQPLLSIGSIDATSQPNQVKLRLVRHPEQYSNFSNYPTNLYMMRHVYTLNAANVTNLDVRIVRDATGRDNPDVPLKLQNSTYLHMFGLDDQNQSGQLRPDTHFDLTNPNLLDDQQGFLFLPGLRPFAPPRAEIIRRIYAARLASEQDTTGVAAGVDTLFTADERLPDDLYRLPATQAQDRWPHKFQIEVTSTGTETEIVLQNDILEGSDVVRLDGNVLERGKDYDIENFAGGRITLKGEALSKVLPTSRLEVSYQFRPLFGGGKSTLLGASGEYLLGSRGKLSSIWLYESTGGFTRRPKLGEEPTRTVLGDINTSFNFRPNWMTRLVNFLPFTDTNAPSSVSLAAEAAISVPDPNTRDLAIVEDLEGADDSDEQNLSRTYWNWASQPLDPLGGLERAQDKRVPVAFYNPVGEVKRGHLNPTLNDREAKEGISVLELGFARQDTSLMTSNTSTNSPELWSGVLRTFPGVGLDLTRTKSIEFWLNDFVSERSLRKGRMHIDFGSISEDFVFLQNRPEQELGDDPSFNREAQTQQLFDPSQDDLGWNGTDDRCNPDAKPDFGSECYFPEVRNADGQHYLADGTEGDHVYDTEDINGNGAFDKDNSYFEITIDLADTAFVVTDVFKDYGTNPNIDPDLRAFFWGWRQYRIDLERVAMRVLKDPGRSEPNLRSIKYLRIWFEDSPNPANDKALWQSDLQIYGLRLTRNQWFDAGVFAVDSTQVAPVPGETFNIGTINNKDDVQYTSPPDTRELDEAGIQAREQSLRLNFDNLEPGHEMVAERNMAGAGRGLDFTQYGRMTYFVHYPPEKPIGTANPDTVEFFFRVGTDTLNYYEIANRVPSPGKGDWLRINVDLDQLTGLKFPEDYPGARVEFLRRGAKVIKQVSAWIKDADEPDLPLRITLRGEPSLQSVSRLYTGVRHPLSPPSYPGRGRGRDGHLPWQPGSLSGEVWFDNVRLEGVQRNRAMAQSYSVATRFADVLELSGGLGMRDAEFRPLRQRLGSGADNVGLRWQASLTDVGRIVPTMGFQIPLSYHYQHDETRPKFFLNSDTRNTEQRKREQRSESAQTGYTLSLSKRPSKFWLTKRTLDRMSFSYAESRSEGRTYVQRDASVQRSRSFKYDLNPRERGLPLWRKWKLNLLPSNMSFQLQHRSGRSSSYKVDHKLDRDTGRLVENLVAQPTSPSQDMTVQASAAMRLLPILSARYTYSEPRRFGRASAYNEAERVKLFGVDFGLPGGSRNEGLSFDLTPRLFRFGYSAGFSDQRTLRLRPDGDPDPDVHRASFNRSRRLSFDFGLHRRLVRWVQRRGSKVQQVPVRREPEPQTGEPPVEPREDEDRPEHLEQEQFETPRHEDRTSPVDSTGAPATPAATEERPPALPQPGSPLTPPPVAAGADSTGNVPPAGGSPPAGAPNRALGTQPPGSATPSGVKRDSTAARRPPIPNPLTLVLRKLGDIEAVKVEFSDNRGVNYNQLADAPSAPFRCGFSTASGLRGVGLPSGDNRRYSLDLSSGLALRSNVRLTTRYKRERGVAASRSQTALGQPQLTNERLTLDTTFPTFDINVTGVEKARLFAKRLKSSTLQMGVTRITSEAGSRDLNPDGSVLSQGPGKSGSERLAITGNWSGQWSRGISSSLGFNQTKSSSKSDGTPSENMTRAMTGSLRFKIAPKNGLRLPFFGRGGTLKSGMDVSINGSYNTSVAKNFSQETRKLAITNSSKALALAVRGDYTLARNMNGGLQIDITRNSSLKPTLQTLTAVRLGFNLTFLF